MADTKLSDLTATTTLAGSDELLVASGSSSKKVTFANLQSEVFDSSDLASASTVGDTDTLVIDVSGTPKAIAFSNLKSEVLDSLIFGDTVFLDTVTASAAATATFPDLDGTYDNYLLIGSGIYSSGTPSLSFNLEFQVDGSVWVSSYAYIASSMDASYSASVATAGSVVSTQLKPGSNISTASYLVLKFGSNSRPSFSMSGYSRSDNAQVLLGGQLNYSPSSHISGVRFSHASMYGTFRLYGLKDT